MKIEEVFTEFDRLDDRVREKAATARDVARKAHKSGNKNKRDKFNAVARAYEMLSNDIGPLCAELYKNTPDEFQNDRDIPF